MGDPEVLKKVVPGPKALVGESDSEVRAEIYYVARDALESNQPLTWRWALEQIVATAALGPRRGAALRASERQGPAWRGYAGRGAPLRGNDRQSKDPSGGKP